MKPYKNRIGTLILAFSAIFCSTSCSDGEEIPIDPIENPKLEFTTNLAKVKIGIDNKILLPVAESAGDYHAYSMNPEIADVETGDDGQMYIVAYKNGITDIIVSDAADNYRRLIVNAYTYDNMQLSHSEYTFITPLGLSSTSAECSVVSGNGNYTVSSDNPKVDTTIDTETGVITMTAKSGRDDYSSTITVSDQSGMSATITVTVRHTTDAFTQLELDNIMALEENGGSYNGSYPSYLDNSSAKWGEESKDGMTTFGGTYAPWGRVSVALQITHPDGTAVGEEVDGTIFHYNYRGNPIDGKVKLLVDDATKRVAIWYNVNLDAEKIDRGYVVWIK